MLKSSVRPFALIGLFLLASFLVFPTCAVILEWDPNTETNLAGYRVHYGLGSRNYAWSVQVPAPLTTAMVTNLQGNGTYFFAVTAFDTDGLESEFSDEVSMTLTGDAVTNSVPIAVSAFFQTLDDQPRAIVLTGTDADGDSLKFDVISLPLHGQLAGVAPNLTYTPDPDFYGIDHFLFIATDGHMNSVPATISILASTIHDQPKLDAIANLSINEDSGASVVTLSGIRPGDANEEEAMLTVTAISSNPGLIPHPTVSYYNPKSIGTLTFTPSANASGTATIEVTVDDGFSSFTRPFTVSVNAVNDPPKLDAISNLSVDENSGSIEVNLFGIGSGASDEAQFLTVTATSSNLTLIPNPTVRYSSPNDTGTLTFTPTADAWGTATIVVTIDDGQRVNGTFHRSFRVTVRPVNDARIVDAGADQTVTLPATATLAGSVTDDGFPNPPGVLTTGWSKLSGPGLVTFSAPDSVVATASFSQPGQYVLRLTASDGVLSASDDVRVEVLDGRPPFIADLAIVGMDARTIAISLHTDEPTICSVEFGTETSLGTTNVEPVLTAGHVIALTNLQPATEYFVRIRATDADSHEAVTEIFTVTTPPNAFVAWAADAGTLVPPMAIGADVLGSFVWSPRHGAGAVSFDFHLPTASQYRVWCQVRTVSADVGSFYVSFDDDAEFILDAGSSDWQTGWRWVAINDSTGSIGAATPWPGFLDMGRHRLVFRANQAVTLLYQVALSNDPHWVPR